MSKKLSLTLVWWTIPFRWIFWFCTIFASTIGLFEFGQDFLGDDIKLSGLEQVPMAFVSSIVGVIFLTNEKILNVRKNKKDIESIESRVSNLESDISKSDLDEILRIEKTTDKLTQYGVKIDPWYEIKLGHAAELAGRTHSANRYYSQALASFQKKNDLGGQAASFSGLGNVSLVRGDVEDAENQFFKDEKWTAVTQKCSKIPLEAILDSKTIPRSLL